MTYIAIALYLLGMVPMCSMALEANKNKSEDIRKWICIFAMLTWPIMTAAGIAFVLIFKDPR